MALCSKPSTNEQIERQKRRGGTLAGATRRGESFGGCMMGCFSAGTDTGVLVLMYWLHLIYKPIASWLDSRNITPVTWRWSHRWPIAWMCSSALQFCIFITQSHASIDQWWCMLPYAYKPRWCRIHQSLCRIIKYHNPPLGQWILWLWGKMMTLQVLSAYINFDVHLCVCVCEGKGKLKRCKKSAGKKYGHKCAWYNHKYEFTYTELIRSEI